eukprot:9468027-Pyramimonas_sp.AAC.1
MATLRNRGSAVSGPPLASPKMIVGCSAVPRGRQPGPTSTIPLYCQSSVNCGSGVRVHGAGIKPLSQKHAAASC